jgi:hypothetical protein
MGGPLPTLLLTFKDPNSMNRSAIRHRRVALAPKLVPFVARLLVRDEPTASSAGMLNFATARRY